MTPPLIVRVALVLFACGVPGLAGALRSIETPAPSEAAVSVDAEAAVPGRFSISGSRIFGPDGKPFVARGVNVDGYQWVWRRSTIADVDLIAKCWRFNAIRINSFLFKGQTRWPQYDTNDNLDAIVEAFTRRGIVTIVEAHDRIGTYFEGADLDRLARWYVGLARQYRSNPYVWFDLQNEPGSGGPPDAALWIGTHRTLISAIRDEAGADNVILVEGSSWGQDGRSGTNPLAGRQSAILRYGKDVLSKPGGSHYSNIAFSIHVYEQWNGGDERLAGFLDRVSAEGLAIVVGEYGGGGGDGSSTRPATESLFRVAPPRGIGRLAWHWTGDPPNVLTTAQPLGGGWQIDSCRDPTNLSWMGRLAWNDTHQSEPPRRGAQSAPIER